MNLEDIESAASLVYQTLSPTPQIAWPLLAERCGCEVWVKHENHLPTGAFKVRGGLVYFDWLKRTHSDLSGWSQRRGEIMGRAWPSRREPRG